MDPTTNLPRPSSLELPVAKPQELVIIPILSFQGYNIDRSINGIIRSFHADFFQEMHKAASFPAVGIPNKSRESSASTGANRQNFHEDILQQTVSDSQFIGTLEEFDITPMPSFQEKDYACRSINDIKNAFSYDFFPGSSDDEESLSSSTSSTAAFDDDDDVDRIVNNFEFDIVLDGDIRHVQSGSEDDDHSLCSQSYIRSGMMSKDCCDFVQDGKDENNCPATQEGASRKVHFETDSEGKIKCQSLDFDKSVRISTIKKIYWYGKSDYQRFREDSHKHARKALRSKYAQKFYHVYQACESSKTWSALNANHFSIHLARSKYRGSEQYIFGALLIPTRKQILMKILNMQSTWIHEKGIHLSNGPSAISEEQQIELLGAFSRSLSQRSRRLALLLGQGDAMLVLSQNHAPLHGPVGFPYNGYLKSGPFTIIGKMAIVGRRRKMMAKSSAIEI